MANMTKDQIYRRLVASGQDPEVKLEAYCWELMGDTTLFANSGA